ncbi:MAG: exodeoxyribonuclease V subunit gamma [Acidobacteria bacterium]|nr:exodeoxyribonuclease V subunit gamma [Acidobacteriota bacterium]
MLELIFSNRAEALIEALAARVAARQAGNGFWTPVPIIVPNPLVKRFVREGLAARNGAAANLHFAFLEQALNDALPEGRRLWTPEAVAGRLLVAFEGEGLDGAIARYLQGEGRGRKALQLAQRLASRFLDYALHRPDWVRLWRQGKDAGEAGWQGRLFKAVDAELSSAGFLCPTDLPDEAANLRWPEGALFVSLNTLAPAYLELMRRLGERADLAFFVLNPCEGYWGDHPSRKAFLDHGVAPEGHPALGLWGRPGRDFVARLYDLAEGQDECHYDRPGRATLLSALQDDMLAMREPLHFEGGDRSLRILAAPGARREAEVVATEIWNLLEASQGALTFADIAIVVPASESETYLGHLRAAFEDAGRLPLAFESGTRGTQSLLAEACGLLLDLLGSEATRAAVLRFLRHPASVARRPDLDADAALALCERTGIVRGLDTADFEGTYLFGLDRLHWAQGLDRAALAAFLPDGLAPQGRDLPAATVDRDAALALDALIEDLRVWRGPALRDPKAWVEAFLRLVDRHLGDDGEAWVRARRAARERLMELARYAPEGLPAPDLAFPEARALMRAKLAQMDDRPEGGGGIRVSTAMPMRAVPYRAVFVMGLAEGLFPATDRVDALDLRQKEGNRRGGDLGRAEQDRYLFLEQILSARDALRLSYPSADPVTGDERPRSSVLEDLLEILQAMTGDAASLVETHPLRRFDATYFTEGATLRSLSPGAAREAQALSAGAAPCIERLPEAMPFMGPLRITLSQLHAWLMEPAEGFAKIRLGMRDEGEDEAARDAEGLTVEDLHASSVERDALVAALNGGDPLQALDHGWRALELEARVPLGPPGEAAKRASRARINAWREHLPSGTYHIHRFGTGAGSGQDVVHPPLCFEVEVEGRPMTVELEGRTRLVHADHLVEVVRKGEPDAGRKLERHLRLRVDQLALAAMGLQAPRHLFLADAKGKLHERIVASPDSDSARAQLHAWIAAIVSGGPIHRLPAAYALDRGPEPSRWIEGQDRRREPWTVLPGSVLRGLPAPDRDTAMRELAFRLGPLLEMGDAP